MFKIQNIKPGYFCLDLENSEKGKGRSISIPPGGYLDLDKYCSRKWISSDKNFNKVLQSKAVRVVHDSEVGIAPQTINTAVKMVEVPAPKPRDLKRIPEIPTHIDPPEVIDLSVEKPVEKFAEVIPEPEPEPKEDADSVDPVEEAISNAEELKVLLENKPKRRRGRPKQKKEDVEDEE